MEPAAAPSRAGSDLDFADTLWQLADKFRGTVDAAEYKHVVLGLLFLKYVSDAFEARLAAAAGPIAAPVPRSGNRGDSIRVRELRAMDDFWNDKARLDTFWDDSDYFTGPQFTNAAVREAEKRLGYKLPEAYLRLLRVRNGGSPRRPYFHVEGLAGWDTGYFQVDSLRGIGHEDWSIDTNDMGDNYPDIGLRICDTPSGGHDAVMLDYSQCGPKGEPRVVHAEQGCDASEVTVLAPAFMAFVASLSDRLPLRAE